MAYNTLSETRIRVYPRSAVTVPSRNAFAQAVDLSTVMRRDQGDNAGMANTGMIVAGPGNSANSWTQPDWDGTELQYVHFLPNGTFLEGADAVQHGRDRGEQGFTLFPRELFYDCLMPAQTGDPAASGQVTATNLFHWSVVAGSTVGGNSAWRTVMPSSNILARRVTHLAQAANTSVIILSVEALPPNQSGRWDVSFRGIAQGQTSTPYLVLPLSSTYRLILPSNKAPFLQRRDTATATWVSWRVLNNAPVIRMHGPGKHDNLIVRFRLIGPFLVLDFDTGGHVTKIWVADVYFPPQSSSPNQPKPVVRDITWPAGQYQIEMFGCQATVGYAAIVYRDPLLGTQFNQVQGTFHQTLYTTYPGSATGGGATAGWIKRGTSTNVKAVWSPRVGGGVTQGGQIDVTVTLNPNVTPVSGQLAYGTDTPFVSRYTCSNLPSPVPGSGAYIEIQNACVDGDIDIEEPTGTSASKFHINFDRRVLSGLSPSWTDTINDGSPITVEQRWRDSANGVGSWDMLFQGFVANHNFDTDGVDSQHGLLYCLDKMMYLQEPWGMINERWLPLDDIGMQSGNAVYGAQGVEYILRQVFGDTEADAMNGGLGPLAYLPADHYALIDGANDNGGITLSISSITMAPTNPQGFLFPPPINKAASTWIDDIREKDRCVFYYGIPPGGGAHCFMYGRIDLIEAAQDVAGILEVDDADYGGTSLDQLIEQASTQTLPDTSYNICRVTFGPGVEGAAQGLLPSGTVVERRLPDDDPYNSPSLTGERIQEIELDWLYDIDIAARIAEYSVALYRGTRHQRVEIGSRGMAVATFGRLMAPRMNAARSDATLGINAYTGGSRTGQVLRTMKLTHHLKIKEQTFKTMWTTRPRTQTGL